MTELQYFAVYMAIVGFVCLIAVLPPLMVAGVVLVLGKLGFLKDKETSILNKTDLLLPRVDITTANTHRAEIKTSRPPIPISTNKKKEG